MTKLIVALDVPNYNRAISLVDKIDDEVEWVKVGLELYIADGPDVMHTLKNVYNKKVMLDLKLHDIPETVARAVRTCRDQGADMITLHTSGGPKMMDEAARAADGKVKTLGVTVLTSLDDYDLGYIGFQGTVKEQAFRLFRLANQHGLDGVVCSAHEVAHLKLNDAAGMLYVTPGIRFAGDNVADQKRVATPHLARTVGATHAVVGRPIRDAEDPAHACMEFKVQLATVGSAIDS